MNHKTARLFADSAAAALFLLSMAYYWLGNLAHEAFGASFFAALIWHNWRNWRWYLALTKGRYNARRIVSLLLNSSVLIAMTVLVITSFSISRSLFEFLSLPSAYWVKEWHWFSAWWAIVAVGAHIGIQWPKLRALLRLRPTPWLWLCTLFVLPFVPDSSKELGLFSRLSLQYSLDFWDFSQAVMPYFLYLACVIGSIAIISHGTMVFVERLSMWRKLSGT